MITRRAFLRLGTALLASGAATAAYAVVVEPLYRLQVTRYAFTPPGWTPGLRLRLVLVADVHACLPWMSADRVARIIAAANGLGGDMILLLGDYVGTHRFQSPEEPAAWAQALAQARAPLGTHAILGNHDWWTDEEAIARQAGPTYVHRALTAAGIKVYENDAVRMEKDGYPFWLAGLGDQIAFVGPRGWRHSSYGVDDLPGTLAQLTDDAPAILMAHEPDVFPRVPARFAVTLSGHTHGGQIAPFGWRPVVPSHYGSRYAYGHIVEDGRHLVVSGGLGCSILPVRMGSPPELVVIDLGAGPGAPA